MIRRLQKRIRYSNWQVDLPYGGRLIDPWDMDVARVIDDAEGKQQPHDDANHHDGVEDFF